LRNSADSDMLYWPPRAQARRAARAAESEEPPLPITVRQLEALVRISESLARMELSGEATPEHVAVAFELFKQSTMNAMNAGLINTDAGHQAEVRLKVEGALLGARWSRLGLAFKRP